jgi:hypothetical protein
LKNIRSIAKVIRSKNSSPFELTLDIILKERADFVKLREQNAVTRERIAQLYGIGIDEVGKVIYFEPAKAIKIGLRRAVSSGAPGDSDVYGAQQHAPLLELDFDL